MSQTIKIVFVGAIYNWEASSTKEIRKKHEYPRHNWCDIDNTDIKNLESVISVFKKYNVNCVSQRCGKGFHVWGDLVTLDIWQKIWQEIKQYADPLWPPHTIRITKKRENEVWERPIYHKHESDPPKWARSLMHFLCKVLRNENGENIWSAMHATGLNKYFQCTVYPVEIKA